MERLLPGAKLSSCWKGKYLPEIVTVDAYVIISSMDSQI